ncbi:MAG: sigma-70 family RNA polymerase sigma factor [Actinomycetota bacterium]
MTTGEASFEEFFQTEYTRLFRSLCLVTGSRDEADEVAQTAFLKLLERWDRVGSMTDPTGFLYRTAMNEFRSRYRSTTRALKRAISFERTDDAFEVVEDRDVVIQALRTLIPQQRAAVVLTALLGYSSEDAGRMLGMKPATVRTLSSRARSAMRQTLGAIR